MRRWPQDYLSNASLLRPSEMLSLECSDVSLPEVRADSSERAIIALGVRQGTKAKRPQAVILDDATLVGLLRYLMTQKQFQGRLFEVSYATFRKLLIQIQENLNMQVGYTPHSPRAGLLARRCRKVGTLCPSRKAADGEPD